MSQTMQQRFRLYRRGWGVYYVQDTQTGKHTSLGTANKQEAQRLHHARNEAHRQPLVNREIGRAYLAAADPAALTRTWQQVMDEILLSKSGKTLVRWQSAVKDRAFVPLLKLPLVETRAEHFLQVLRNGTVATNAFLRRLQNFAQDMRWLMGPVLVKRQWPRIQYGEKRGITLEEHTRLVASEPIRERQLYYTVLWFTGGSQSDIATLGTENLDWEQRTIMFDRMKLKWRKQSPPVIRISPELEAILRELPPTGPLFPSLIGLRESDRAAAFKYRCDRLGIQGVTLHSYRYAWAERAKACGYPERYAQQALGHTSKAVHRAYSRKAQFVVPSFEDFAKNAQEGKIIHIDLAKPAPQESQPPAAPAENLPPAAEAASHRVRNPS